MNGKPLVDPPPFTGENNILIMVIPRKTNPYMVILGK